MQNAVFFTSSDHLGSGVMMRARRHARTADERHQGSEAASFKACRGLRLDNTALPSAFAEAGVSHFW